MLGVLGGVLGVIGGVLVVCLLCGWCARGVLGVLVVCLVLAWCACGVLGVPGGVLGGVLDVFAVRMF